MPYEPNVWEPGPVGSGCASAWVSPRTSFTVICCGPVETTIVTVLPFGATVFGAGVVEMTLPTGTVSEDRDRDAQFGDSYSRYRQQMGMMLPQAGNHYGPGQDRGANAGGSQGAHAAATVSHDTRSVQAK